MQKILLAILLITSLFAKEKTFVQEYTYQASKYDSKVSSRANALEQVRKLLLEEVSVFFINEIDCTKGNTYIDGKYIIDEQTINSILAETTEINVIYQKWNTKTYMLTGKLSLDTDNIRERINKIIDKKQTLEALSKIKNNGKDSASNKVVITMPPDKNSNTSASNKVDTSKTPNIKFVAYDIPPKSIIPIRPIYPEKEKESGIEGTIYIQYFIDIKGNVTEAWVIQGMPNTGLDASALSAVKKSSWKPALQGEKKVGVWQTVPVKFALNAK